MNFWWTAMGRSADGEYVLERHGQKNRGNLEVLRPKTFGGKVLCSARGLDSGSRKRGHWNRVTFILVLFVCFPTFFCCFFFFFVFYFHFLPFDSQKTRETYLWRPRFRNPGRCSAFVLHISYIFHRSLGKPQQRMARAPAQDSEFLIADVIAPGSIE